MSKKSSVRSNMTGGPSNLTGASTASRDLSAVLTVDGSDSSGTNPPPTMSDGSSSKSSLSGFSRELGGHNGGGRGRDRPSPHDVRDRQDQAMPPAPPFQRNVNADMYDDISTYTNSAPVRTVSKFGDSDTIISDPTLDPSLFPPPSSPLKNSGSTSRTSNNSSFNKKCSDETDYKNYRRGSSDENPSSQSASEAGEVDNIVAAALAYAERTHGDDSGGRSGSDRRSRSRSAGKRSGSAGRRRSSNANRTEGDASSSIHSFYTDDEGAGGRASNSQSTGNPRYTGPGGAAPVDDLVAQALSHAQGQFTGGLGVSGKSGDRNGPASFHGSNPQAHSYESKKGAASFHASSSNNDIGGAPASRSGAMANQKANFKSEYSAWNKSVMSMYSEETEGAESVGDQYDC